MLVRKLILVVFCLLSSVLYAQVAADKIIGVYLTEQKDAKVRIYKVKGKYYGKIIWMKIPRKANGKLLLDEKNPNPALRNKPVLGLVMISNFVYSKGEWINGRIYGPKDGIVVKGTLKVLANRNLEMKISYMMMSKKWIWKRIK